MSIIELKLTILWDTLKKNEIKWHSEYVRSHWKFDINKIKKGNTMLNEGLKRCVDCGLYSKDCGYWKKSYRKKNPNLPKKEDNHNCGYFKPKQS